MGRLLLILVALVVGLSLTWGSVAHSREPVTCVESTTAEALGHSTGDDDQVPSDSDKGYAHHHGGCQGHQVCDAVNDGALGLRAIAVTPEVGPWLTFVPSSPADPSLRPPIA